MKKILLFTHNDLDGIGVKIVGELYAKEIGKEIECFTCGYGNINKIVSSRISGTYKDYDEIIIGDISVKEEVAEELNNLYKEGIKILLIDHHETALWLNKYEWCNVNVKVDGELRCGTYQLAHHPKFSNVLDKIKVFVECVDSYDVWRWKTENNIYPKQLNSLLFMLGIEKFCEFAYSNFINVKTEQELLSSDIAKILIEVSDRKAMNKAHTCEVSMVISRILYKDKYYKCGIVNCDEYISEVADIILGRNNEIDILILLNLPHSISFRTQKDLDISLGDFSQHITGQGGGHYQAAGARIDTSQVVNFTNKLFKSLNKNIQLRVENAHYKTIGSYNIEED